MSKQIITSVTNPNGTLGKWQVRNCVPAGVNLWSCDLQLLPNNYQRPNAPTSQIHATINALDARFHGLTVATQNAWQAESAAHPWWQLCGCDDHTQTAQKLYRNTNLNRQLVGLPQVDLPPSDADWFDYDIAFVVRGHTATPGIDQLGIYPGGDASGHPVFFKINSGLGMQTKVFTPTPSFPWLWYTGDPDFTTLWELCDHGTIHWCIQDPQGYPGESNVSPVIGP